MPKKIEEKKEKKEKKVKVDEFFHAVGRRKESTARIRLYPAGNGKVTVGTLTVKKGEVFINSRPAEEYFTGLASRKIYLEPFRTTNTVGRFAVTARVSGGGLNGQLGAFIHGVSRALLQIDKEKFRPILRKKG